MIDLTIIILTYNEEKNIQDCLDSIKSTNANIFVVDSFSTDATLNIFKKRKINYTQHPFENYAAQRNWAQLNNPFQTEWVLHLDAGERLSSEMVNWLNNDFQPTTETNGFMFSRRTMIFGKWVKYGGHYPNYHLRLYRTKKGKCENKLYDQHFFVNGHTAVLKPGIDIIDTVMSSWQEFTLGHARWAVFEAIEIIEKTKKTGEVKASLSGSPIEKRRWLKSNLFEKSPLFLRSLLYFMYRYFFRLGFLDGLTGLTFHFLQGFWFRFLIDATVLELKTKMEKENISLPGLIARDYDPKYLRILKTEDS